MFRKFKAYFMEHIDADRCRYGCIKCRGFLSIYQRLEVKIAAAYHSLYQR